MLQAFSGITITHPAIKKYKQELETALAYNFSLSI